MEKSKSESDSGSKKKLQIPSPGYIRSTPYLRLRESISNRFKSPPASPTKPRQYSPPPISFQSLFKWKRPSDKYTNLDDICCIALICPEHQRIGLLDIPQKGLFFPSLSCRMSNYSINSIVREMLNRVFGDVHAKFRNFQLITERIQIPLRNFLFRFIYRIDVSLSTATSTAGGKNSTTKGKTKVSCDQKKKMSSISPSTKTKKTNSSIGAEKSVNKKNGQKNEQRKCICQMVQRTLIHWLSYDDICNKLTSTITLLDSMNTPSSNNVTTTTANNNNLLGPEPKYILEQQFGLLKKRRKSLSTSSSSSNIDNDNDNDDDDPSKYYSLGWNEKYM
uniref:Uncharacterized protein LOC113791386 n=1 Tax=Dermatophagoides pteronyssinus TaxID=6956 RepID=A0A6P6XVS3_DERPT|nr:uncharacterized protein LOC113791386 [Dermatophagoides pteronyssinus]